MLDTFCGTSIRPAATHTATLAATHTARHVATHCNTHRNTHLGPQFALDAFSRNSIWPTFFCPKCREISCYSSCVHARMSHVTHMGVAGHGIGSFICIASRLCGGASDVCVVYDIPCCSASSFMCCSASCSVCCNVCCSVCCFRFGTRLYVYEYIHA